MGFGDEGHGLSRSMSKAWTFICGRVRIQELRVLNIVHVLWGG